MNLKSLKELVELERQRDALNATIDAKMEEVREVIDMAETKLDAPLEEMYVIQNPSLWNAKAGSFKEVLTAKLHNHLKAMSPKWATDRKECRQARLLFISTIIERPINSTKELTVAELRTLVFLLEIK